MAYVALFTVWFYQCRCGWPVKSRTEQGARAAIANHVVFDCCGMWDGAWDYLPVQRIWAFNVSSSVYLALDLPSGST